MHKGTNTEAEPAFAKTATAASYFPGLNGLRAIAAVTVMFMHINQFLPVLFHASPFVAPSDIAELSVVLFFVLSGFLITWLLLQEKETKGTVSLKRFYARRMRRIWPLYFLVVFISICLFPLYKDISGNPLDTASRVKALILFMLILPNFNSVFGLMFTPLRALWSIGVEEEFYLLWGVLLKKSQRIERVILLFIALYVLCILAAKAGTHFLPPLRFVYALLQITPMHILATGALGACLVRRQHKLLKWVYYPAIQVLCLLVWCASYVVQVPAFFLKHELYGLLFLVIIVNTATNKKALVSFEYEALNYAGRISYGIYVYHMLLIVVAYLLLRTYNINNWLLAALIAMATFIAASASYELYEKKFLRRKRGGFN